MLKDRLRTSAGHGADRESIDVPVIPAQTSTESGTNTKSVNLRQAGARRQGEDRGARGKISQPCTIIKGRINSAAIAESGKYKGISNNQRIAEVLQT